MESKEETKKVEEKTNQEGEALSKDLENKVEIKEEVQGHDATATAKPMKPEDDEIENQVKEEDIPISDMTWDEMGIPEKIKEGFLEMGFVSPSKVQMTTFPLIMKKPYTHLVAQAKNGAGKTASFGLGVIARVDENDPSIQAIVFAHTRELVNQIEEVLGKIASKTKIKVSSLQTQDKDKEVGQVVIITPGSFENFFLKRKKYSLDKLKILVLDEADYMLTNDVTVKVCDKTFKYIQEHKLPVQVLFFSATYTKDNFKVIKKYYKKLNMIELNKEELTLKNVKQCFFKVEKKEDKINFIGEYLKRTSDQTRVIIFVNTRNFVVNLQKKLGAMGYQVYILMGGDMDPKNRDETIKKFNKGEIQILITTNLLARGYDERLVKLVINFDIPVVKVGNHEKADPETYLHRIGRTGRFGSKGVGLTLVSGEADMAALKAIQDYYKSTIDEISSLDALMTEYKKYLYDV